MDAQNLLPAFAVRQRDFHLHLQATRTGQGLVDHVLPVGHADHEDVVDGVHSIDFRQQLIDNRITNPCVITSGASCFADGIDLVKDDDVQRALVAALLVLGLGIGKKIADVFFGLPNKFVENFRSQNYFRLTSIQHLANLSRHQRLARPRRAKEQHALDVLDAQALHQLGREDAGRKGAPKDALELLVQPADAQVLELEVGLHNGGHVRGLGSPEFDQRVLRFDKRNGRLFHDLSKVSTLTAVLLRSFHIHQVQVRDHTCQIDAVVLKGQLLSAGKHLCVKLGGKSGCHLLAVVRLLGAPVLGEKIDLERERVQVLDA
eukprot:Lithocolla_globosa_v1_NODE_1889_length_2271_cov_14.911101.p2 type:complete len:318 gc:universal NODE_1889_length_2271_cov_14.911101:997-1950(+)